MIVFDNARTEDLPTLVALLADDPLGAKRERGGVDGAYRRAFDAIEADPAQYLFVAREGLNVVALCQLSIIPGLTYHGRPRGQIEGVRVATSQRGKGLGRQLIEHAIAVARDAGCVLVQLTTDRQRPDAVRFYASLGFVDSHHGMKLRLQD